MARRWYKPRMSETGEKVRNVLLIIWKEELEKNGHTYGDLLAWLDSLQVECAVSPVHDRDVWTSQGVLNWCTMHIDELTGDLGLQYVDTAPYVGMNKKAHYHLLFKVKSQQDAAWWSENMFRGFLDIKESRWEKCLNVESSERYMAHMDSPDKHPYDPMAIHSFGGLDLSAINKKSEEDKRELLIACHQIIDHCNFRYFYQLVDEVRKCDPDLLAYVRGSSAYFNGYLRSLRDEMQDKNARKKKGE